MRLRLWPLVLTSAAITRLSMAAPSVLTIDFRHPAGTIRPLHGINKGPLAAGGLVDVTGAQRALAPPFIRLHDAHWPNPDVVDIHTVFPDPKADPDRPESYDFRLTDEYLAATRVTGAQIVYRLGESIEHTSVKRWVHPPADPEHWARVAVGIIRHCNEGWAEGHRWNIRYWEIWNEPDNRPACWIGTDAQYFSLYAAAARAIKARFPEVKVGGPAVGNTGELSGDDLRPSPFVEAFLRWCRQEALPLDFFSWHCYTADSGELVRRARAVRRLLDAGGFPRAESHLNEWNYLPDGQWDGISKSAAPTARQRFYERMAGAEGAAFIAEALVRLQDAPVDAACLFHGEVGGFGLFNEAGVPAKSYYAVQAFRELLETPRRMEVPGSDAGTAVLAGASADGKSAAVLISRRAGSGPLRLRVGGILWTGGTTYQVRLVDAAHDLAVVREGDTTGDIAVDPPATAVLLVTLRPATRQAAGR